METEKAHQLFCYGLEEITRVYMSVTTQLLKRIFPEVDLAELRRPEKIELLLSHWEGKLAPQRVKILGDLQLERWWVCRNKIEKQNDTRGTSENKTKFIENWEQWIN